MSKAMLSAAGRAATGPVAVLSLLECAAVAAPLAAQRADTARADSARIILPAVTVSATRDERPAFLLPLASTRVATESNAGGGGAGLEQALAFVPGVLAQSRGGWTDLRITIRGFGARGAGDRSNAGTARGIRVLLDGVPETEPDGRTAFDNVDPDALASLEVVRSNASSLWGNAAGGVISLSTIPETPGRTTADLRLSVGGFGLRRASLRTAVPIADGVLAATLVGGSFDGWREHADARRLLLALSTSALLRGNTRLSATAIATDNAYRIPGPLTAAQADSAPHMANPVYAARDEHRHNRQARLSATLENEFEGDWRLSGSVFAMPKYLQRSERGTFRDFTRYHVGGNVVVHGERRLGEANELRFLAGADEACQDGSALFYSLEPDGTRGDTLRTNKREGANNAGVFAQGELDLGDRWIVIAGARWDAIRYTYTDFIQPQLDDARTFSGLVPKLGVTLRLAPRHTVYAGLGGGIEAPAANETDPAGTFGQDTVTGLNPLLEPIRSTTLEFGTKHVVSTGGGLLSAVRYDAALFLTDVRNDIVPYRGGRFYFTAGKTRRIGLEAGLTLFGPAGLTLEPVVSLIRARYVDYVVDSVHYGNPGAVADYGGNAAAGIPPATWAVGLSWEPRSARLALRINVHGVAAYWADDANTVRVPAYAIADLQAGTTDPLPLGEGIGLTVLVALNNAFDARHIGSAFINPDVVNGEPVAFEPGMPRQLVLSLGVTRR
jgi:iron complex outermembrane receptor protein